MVVRGSESSGMVAVELEYISGADRTDLFEVENTEDARERYDEWESNFLWLWRYVGVDLMDVADRPLLPPTEGNS